MEFAIKLLTSTMLYTCLATVLSQGAVMAYLWSQGAMDPHKARQVAAVLSGVEMAPAQENAHEASDTTDEQHSYEKVLEQRVLKSLDLDLREQAVAKGLSDLRALTDKLAEDTRRFDLRREAFKTSLKQLEEGAKDAAITEVRRTLESLKARQAKDQLIRMLDDRENEQENMQAVVTIVKAMALDKRKKLLAEFKDGDEPDRLGEILEQILQGVPETTVIQQTQEDLAAPQP